MLVQNGEHFKALAVIESALVVEKEPKRTLADRRTKLPLPKKTSSNVGRSRNQQRFIRELGAVLGLTEPVEDHVIDVQVGLRILEDGKLEILRRRTKRHRRGRDDHCRRRNWRRRYTTTQNGNWRKNRRRSRRDCCGNTNRVRERHRQIRRGREIFMGQRTMRRSSKSSGRCHRCRRMMMSHRRSRSKRKPPIRWGRGGTVTPAKDDLLGNHGRNRPWKVELAIVFGHRGS